MHAKASDYLVRVDGGKYDRDHYYQSPQSYTSLFCDKVKIFGLKYASLLLIIVFLQKGSTVLDTLPQRHRMVTLFPPLDDLGATPNHVDTCKELRRVQVYEYRRY